MDAAALLAALRVSTDRNALLALQAATINNPLRTSTSPPAGQSMLQTPMLQTPVTGFGMSNQTYYVQPQVMQAPVACGGILSQIPSDASARICQLALLLDMVRELRAPTTQAPVVFQQSASPPQQPRMLALQPMATAANMTIRMPSSQGHNNQHLRPAPAHFHYNGPSPEMVKSSSQMPIDSEMSTPSHPDPNDADIGGTFMPRERILRIFSLRSRHTCTSSSPMEKSAAGRSAVVARIYGMPVGYVRDIWSRACASQITEPVWAEYEEQRYENKMISNLRRSALKRKRQCGQEAAARQRKCLVDSESQSQSEDSAGTPPPFGF